MSNPMTPEVTRDLLQAAQDHLDKAADAAPVNARRAILTGKVEDERLSLFAQMAHALAALTAPQEAVEFDFGSSCWWCDPDHRGAEFSEDRHAVVHAQLGAPQEGDARERLSVAIGDVLFNVSNFPEKVRARLLGQDMAPLRKKLEAAILAAFPVLSLAAVPDAATELRAERDAALAAIERCREVAMQHRSVEQHNEMVPVTDMADLIREPSSADYLAALDGAPEPEWEYGGALESDPDEATAHPDKETALKHIEGWNESVARIKRMGRHTSGPSMLVRRRKAGPWLPVEGEEL